jgi:hypothetical protein
MPNFLFWITRIMYRYVGLYFAKTARANVTRAAVYISYI